MCLCCKKESVATQDDYVPGLRWVPGTAAKCGFLAFMQERIQDWAIVKRKKAYSGRYALHRQSVRHLRRRETPG